MTGMRHIIQSHSYKKNAEQHTHACGHMDNTAEDHISSGRGVGMMEEVDKKKVK